MSASVVRAVAVVAALVGLSACGPTSQQPKVLVSAPSGNWVSLFDGKSLEGWTPKLAGSDPKDNYQNTFRVEDGLLKVSYRDYHDGFGNRIGALYYDKPFSHYWLRVEYRFVGDLAKGAPSWAYKNSGLQLHSQAPDTLLKEQQFPVSVEFDLVGGRFMGSQPTGNVCRNGTNLAIGGTPLTQQCSKVSDITIRDEQWVTALAEVDGAKRVRQIVNGALVVEYTDLTLDEKNADARRLIAAGAAKSLSTGYISLQSNGAPIEFRRVEVLPLDTAAP